MTDNPQPGSTDTEVAGSQSGSCQPCITEFYASLIALGIHGQENKWWMLYIFLVFNTILVLSCATILVDDPYGLLHQLTLSVLCIAGLVVAFCWLFMVPDYVNASNLYSDIAREAESRLPAGIRRPLTERQTQRGSKSRMGTSSFIAGTFPVLFLIVYVVFLVLSWSSLRTHAAL
jgi:hypothetical protein